MASSNGCSRLTFQEQDGKDQRKRRHYGSFMLQETDLGMDSDSDPIPVIGSWDWNLTLTLCSVKTSA